MEWSETLPWRWQDEEDAPLARRRKMPATATATASAPPPPPPFAFREGQQVEVRLGDAWQAARVDNINEEEGTYDVVLQDGDDEDGVSADRLRPL